MFNGTTFRAFSRYFSCAHRYYLPGLTTQENQSYFGTLASVIGVGHNFLLQIESQREYVSQTRMATEQILKELDHCALHRDLPFFQENISSLEMIAQYVGRNLKEFGLKQANFHLWETQNLFVSGTLNNLEQWTLGFCVRWPYTYKTHHSQAGITGTEFHCQIQIHGPIVQPQGLVISRTELSALEHNMRQLLSTGPIDQLAQSSQPAIWWRWLQQQLTERCTTRTVSLSCLKRQGHGYSKHFVNSRPNLKN